MVHFNFGIDFYINISYPFPASNFAKGDNLLYWLIKAVHFSPCSNFVGWKFHIISILHATNLFTGRYKIISLLGRRAKHFYSPSGFFSFTKRSAELRSAIYSVKYLTTHYNSSEFFRKISW